MIFGIPKHTNFLFWLTLASWKLKSGKNREEIFPIAFVRKYPSVPRDESQQILPPERENNGKFAGEASRTTFHSLALSSWTLDTLIFMVRSGGLWFWSRLERMIDSKDLLKTQGFYSPNHFIKTYKWAIPSLILPEFNITIYTIQLSPVSVRKVDSKSDVPSQTCSRLQRWR